MPINLETLVLQTCAMCLTALLIPKLRVTSIVGPIGAVLALAFVNSSLWDAALFFQIPDSLGAHAAILLGANGLLFWIIVKLLPGIEVDGVLPALVAPIVFTICSVLIVRYHHLIDWHAVLQWILNLIMEVKNMLMREPTT